MPRITDSPAGPSRRPLAWTVALITGLSLAGLGLAGCSAAPATPATAVPTPSSTVSDSPTPPPAPTLLPTGTATDNLPFFDSVITAAIGAEPDPVGRTYIDALAGAGFDKAQMEITADTTTEGNPADSIQFSVRFNGECLVGQNGPSSGGYHSMVAAELASGTCLVGATRQIDW